MTARKSLTVQRDRSIMNEILYEIMKVVVMITALIVTRYLVPMLKAKLDTEKLELVKLWVNQAVLKAQQVMQSESGSERKTAVMQFLQEILVANNISISDEQLDTLIEAAVKQMKMEAK